MSIVLQEKGISFKVILIGESGKNTTMQVLESLLSFENTYTEALQHNIILQSESIFQAKLCFWEPSLSSCKSGIQYIS